MKHLVVLTGAGISAESGLATFRGKDGMWTNEEWLYLASHDALYNDTQRSLDFYNWRRKQLSEVEPNHAHRVLAELEKKFSDVGVTIEYFPYTKGTSSTILREKILNQDE